MWACCVSQTLGLISHLIGKSGSCGYSVRGNLILCSLKVREGVISHVEGSRGYLGEGAGFRVETKKKGTRKVV